MNIPRDINKLKSKFFKPITLQVVLNEFFENEPVEDVDITAEVELDVVLEEGRSFCFVYSEGHTYYFLFVECDKKDFDMEYYASRPLYHDFILMNVYAITDQGRQNNCIVIEFCILYFSTAFQDIYR